MWVTPLSGERAHFPSSTSALPSVTSICWRSALESSCCGIKGMRHSRLFLTLLITGNSSLSDSQLCGEMSEHCSVHLLWPPGLLASDCHQIWVWKTDNVTDRETGDVFHMWGGRGGGGGVGVWGSEEEVSGQCCGGQHTHSSLEFHIPLKF